MTESAKRTGKVVRIAAAVLLVPAFGAGVWVGRSMLERRPPAEDWMEEPAWRPWLRVERRERLAKLATCQEKLAARSEARAAPSAADAPPGETQGDAGETRTTVEALEKETKECRKRELLADADICRSVGRHFRAMKALPDDGKSCMERAMAGDVLKDDFKKCADFDGVPTHLDLTAEEKGRIMDAVHLNETLTRTALVAQRNRIHQTCLETAEKNRRRTKRF